MSETTPSGDIPTPQDPGTGPEQTSGPADVTESPIAVDPAPLHSLVDQITAALHAYVDVAVGVRAEFDAETADDDPRVEAAEQTIEKLNTAFDEVFESSLGMTSGHTGYWWEEGDDDEDDEDESPHEALRLEMLVERGDHTDDAFDDVLTLLDDSAQRLAEELEQRGFVVPQWACGHERYADDEDDKDDE